MKLTGEDLTSLPNSQLKATPAITAALSFFGAPLMAVLFSWLVDKTGGGDELKQQVIFYLLGTGAFGAATGVVGTVQRGLKLTDAKIKNQTPRDLPDTINAGGDVNVGDDAAPVVKFAPQVLAEPVFFNDIGDDQRVVFDDPVAPGPALPSE